MTKFTIDPDITTAVTLDSSFYNDAAVFDLAREKIFTKTWQWTGTLDDVRQTGSVVVREILPGLHNEPVILVRDEADQLRCSYHGRRFDLRGTMLSMPEFSETKNSGRRLWP